MSDAPLGFFGVTALVHHATAPHNTCRLFMKPLHVQTPLIESLWFGALLKKRVWMKIEALQPTGSFKLRGVGYACQHYVNNGAEQLVSSSGGNAGIAVAYAGRKLGIPVTVVVPESTSKGAMNAIQLEGARIHVKGESWQEAHDHCLQLADGKHCVMIHPFDDPLLWDGHATIIDEVVETGLSPDVVILSVGGGGLLCGVVEGLRRNNMEELPVVAVETKGAHSLRTALENNGPYSLEKITSIATSLGAKKVANKAFEYASQYPIRSHVISDLEAVKGCQQFLDHHRILVEPACGASIATLLQPPEVLSGCDTILVIVCGGIGVSVNQLQRWSEELPE